MRMTRLLVAVCSVLVGLAASADHHKASVVGVWHGVGVGPNGDESESTMTITKKDGKLVGNSVNEQGDERNLDRIKFDGTSLHVEIDIDLNGQSGVLGVKAKLGSNGELKGNWFANDDGGTELYSGDWSAVRNLSKVAVGSWNVVAVTDDGDMEHQISIKKEGYRYTGTVEGDAGSLDLENLRVKKNKISFEFAFGDGTVKVAAAQTGPTKLAGEWTYFDSSDQELGSGKWTANK